jgi:hypothetical protein
MLKNESAQNSTKPTPLRPAHLPDSGDIIFISNGVRMKKISHSVRRAKQEKFLTLLTVQSVQSVRMLTWHVHTCDTWKVRTGHVASPERDTCQADLAFSTRSWTNPKVTRVTTERVTRGRVTSAADMAG